MIIVYLYKKNVSTNIKTKGEEFSVAKNNKN